MMKLSPPMDNRSTLLMAIALAAILGSFQVANALVCYDCNSEYDRRCGDPFDPYSIGLVNCSKQEPPEHLKDRNKPILCRKTTQKVYGKERVVRGCGYIPDERTDDRECLKRSGTHDVQAVYCACTADLCNVAAPGLRLNSQDNIRQLLSYTFAALSIVVITTTNLLDLTAAAAAASAAIATLPAAWTAS